MPDHRQLFLLCRIAGTIGAVPLTHVEETMRPLPLERLVGLPSFVCGVAVIRGVPTPVVDTGVLLHGRPSAPTRFVTIKTGPRRVAFAVDAVVGINDLTRTPVGELPPLLSDFSSASVSAIGALDAGLLVVLQSARMVPDAVWAILDRNIASA